MTSTLQLQRRLRRIVPVVVIVVGLILISAIMIQQVAAQDSGGLKPPFKLHQPADLPKPLSGVPPLPFSAPIVMSETFDSGFAVNVRYNYNVNDTSVPWHLVNASGLVDTSYTWGRVAGVPLTDTLWNAATNPPGKPPIAAGQPYTKNMQAYAVYGPINMTDYTSAFISITYRMDVMEATGVISDDLFGVAYSTNGTDFTWISAAPGRDPSLSLKRTDYYLIPASIMRQNRVWIALVFTSQNRDDIDALGVFVDNVVMRALPAYKTFMPLVRHDATPTPTATPTLTPTPSAVRYFYAFNDESSTNNPDFNRWGGYKSTTCSGCTVTYYQDLVKTYGNPSPALTLYIQGTNGRGGAGPRQGGISLSTVTNFEYSADFFVYNGQLDARYGLAFDASSGTFPDSGDPPMDPYANYYLLELRMDTATRTKVAKWQFLRVENGTRVALTTAADLPITLNQQQWHNLKVRQQGTSLSFYLNGTLVGSTTYDSNWGNQRRRFGLYLDVRGSNGDNGPFEFFADNITVRDLP